jgi:hypothetical protein
MTSIHTPRAGARALNRLTWACGLLLATASGSALALSNSATVGLSPAATSVTVGQSFDLSVNVLSHSDYIGAYDFDVLFGTAGILSFTGVTFSDALGSGADVASAVSLPNFAQTSLLMDLSGTQGTSSFTLATLHFSALAAGETLVSLNPALLGDTLGDAMSGSYESATVTVTGGGGVPAIPEPSTYALMLLGLGAVAGIGRRAQKSSAP